MEPLAQYLRSAGKPILVLAAINIALLAELLNVATP